MSGARATDAGPPAAGAVESEAAALQRVREAIDRIDGELLRLLNERAALAVEVARIKRAHGAAAELYRPEREAQVLARVRATNPGPLPTEDALRLMREVMSACLALEQPLSVAYLGPAGTYTHAAAQKHFGGSVLLQPAPTIEDVVRDIAAGSVSFGVLPVENSLEGAVNQTLDCLYATPTLSICGEVLLPVHHQLMSRAAELSAIARVYGHPQALAQCRHWLDRNLPRAERQPQSSNAEGARRASQEPDAAAVAGEQAAALYDLPILARNIEDQPDNTTRFLVLGRQAVPPSGCDLTSIVFRTVNRAGALHEVLKALAAANISLTRIESRPQRKGTWEYVFFADIEGHRDESPLAEALVELAARTSFLRILGSYPRAAS